MAVRNQCMHGHLGTRAGAGILLALLPLLPLLPIAALGLAALLAAPS